MPLSCYNNSKDCIWLNWTRHTNLCCLSFLYLLYNFCHGWSPVSVEQKKKCQVHMFRTGKNNVKCPGLVSCEALSVSTKSHPPAERRSEWPVSCSLDSCLSRRCLSLSFRRTSSPPWPSCSLDVCLSSVRRSRLSACSLHTSCGSSSLRAWISCSLESCLSILWSLCKVLVWTWGSAWSLRKPALPLGTSLCRHSRPGSCSTTSAMTATSALPVPTSPIITSLSLPFSRPFSSRLATTRGVTASPMCLILGCRRYGDDFASSVRAAWTGCVWLTAFAACSLIVLALSRIWLADTSMAAVATEAIEEGEGWRSPAATPTTPACRGSRVWR